VPVAELRFWTAGSAARGTHAPSNTSVGRQPAHACGAHGEHALLRAGRLLAGRRRARSGRKRFSRPSGPPRARRFGPAKRRDLRMRAREGRPRSARSNDRERGGAWGSRGWRAATAACAPRRGARGPRGATIERSTARGFGPIHGCDLGACAKQRRLRSARRKHRTRDDAWLRAGGGARPPHARSVEAAAAGAKQPPRALCRMGSGRRKVATAACAPGRRGRGRPNAAIARPHRARTKGPARCGARTAGDADPARLAAARRLRAQAPLGHPSGQAPERSPFKA